MSKGAVKLIQAFLPLSIAEILAQKSKEIGLPMSRLIAIALDNELDSPAPFNYLCLLPNNKFIPMAYLEEAGKIARFLRLFPKGCGREVLLLSRRDIGVPNKETFMLAYRELLETGVVKEGPVTNRAKFKYPPTYKYARLVKIRNGKPILETPDDSE